MLTVLPRSIQRLSTYSMLDNDPGRPPLSERDNQLLFAFWTCLQLERCVPNPNSLHTLHAHLWPRSACWLYKLIDFLTLLSDIIAEIPRHQSGISPLENCLPYPDGTRWLDSWLNGQDNPGTRTYANRLIFSYTAQLFLRKHLNRIHSTVYSDKNTPNVDLRGTLSQLNELQTYVTNMVWAGLYKFDEDDDPARDILSARLRAKYWGAQVITYRPCIKMILDLSFDLRHGEAAAAFEKPSQHVKNAVYRLGDEVHTHAQKGIRALIESTQAFYGLDGDGQRRPIITNVFGTAHA